MTVGKNDLDGQLNLFGNDPYQPKKAKASEEQVELSTEAEEFLAVGRRKKKTAEGPQPAEDKGITEEKRPAEEKKPAEELQTAEDQKPAEREEQPVKKKTRNNTGAEPIVMQQSFSDASGRTITVAYVDYNCIYVEEAGGKATLTQYPDAKTAVDRYLENVSRLSRTDGFKKCKEHPALRRVECKVAE